MMQFIAIDSVACGSVALSEVFDWSDVAAKYSEMAGDIYTYLCDWTNKRRKKRTWVNAIATACHRRFGDQLKASDTVTLNDVDVMYWNDEDDRTELRSSAMLWLKTRYPTLHRLLSMKLAGMKSVEIAGMLDVSEAYVSQAVKKSVECLREWMVWNCPKD